MTSCSPMSPRAVAEDCGVMVNASKWLLPALGNVAGLERAVIYQLSPPARDYGCPRRSKSLSAWRKGGGGLCFTNPRLPGSGAAAVVAAFVVQLWLDSMIIGALTGFVIFSILGRRGAGAKAE